jgi:hypothetical protein
VSDAMARTVCEQTISDRTQGELFFEALRRMLPGR